jgi:hypothetical protein
MAVLLILIYRETVSSQRLIAFRTPGARLIAYVFGVDSNLFRAIKGEHKPTLPCTVGRKDSGFITTLLNRDAKSV